MNLKQTIRRILREDYSPAGKEIMPNKIVVHKSNPMFRDRILEEGLKVRVGECYQIYVNREQRDPNKIKCKPVIFATNSTKKRDLFDSTYDDDIWEINTEMIPDVKWYVDRHYGSKSKHIVTYQDIPREAITLIYEGTGESEDLIEESIRRIRQMMGLDESISDMVKKDQEMRQKETFDTEIDLSNQKQIKKLMGDNPQKFIESLNNKEDIEGVWLIAQHADNDLEFQKMVFDLFDNNKEMLSKKFDISLKEIKYGLAMLTDRIMVNSSTGLQGYRNNNMEDFSEVSSGIQKYGTQGGEYNGKWVPRPIKMAGEVYFFKTPEELYYDKHFLERINNIRYEVGLPSLEEYVQNMQQYV